MFERNRTSKTFWYITSDDDDDDNDIDDIDDKKWKSKFDENGSMLTVIIGTHGTTKINNFIDQIITTCRNDYKDYYIIKPTRFWIQTVQLLCRQVSIKHCSTVVALCLPTIPYNDCDIMTQLRKQARQMILKDVGYGFTKDINIALTKLFTKYISCNAMGRRKVLQQSNTITTANKNKHNCDDDNYDDLIILRYEIIPTEIFDIIYDKNTWLLLLEKVDVATLQEENIIYKIVNTCYKYHIPYVWIPTGWSSLDYFYKLDNDIDSTTTTNNNNNETTNRLRCFCLLKPASGNVRKIGGCSIDDEIQYIMSLITDSKNVYDRKRNGRDEIWPALTQLSAIPVQGATMKESDNNTTEDQHEGQQVVDRQIVVQDDDDDDDDNDKHCYRNESNNNGRINDEDQRFSCDNRYQNKRRRINSDIHNETSVDPDGTIMIGSNNIVANSGSSHGEGHLFNSANDNVPVNDVDHVETPIDAMNFTHTLKPSINATADSLLASEEEEDEGNIKQSCINTDYHNETWVDLDNFLDMGDDHIASEMGRMDESNDNDDNSLTYIPLNEDFFDGINNTPLGASNCNTLQVSNQNPATDNVLVSEEEGKIEQYQDKINTDNNWETILDQGDTIILKGNNMLSKTRRNESYGEDGVMLETILRNDVLYSEVNNTGTPIEGSYTCDTIQLPTLNITSDNLPASEEDDSTANCLPSTQSYFDFASARSTAECRKIVDEDISVVDAVSIRQEEEIALIELAIKAIQSRQGVISDQLAFENTRLKKIAPLLRANYSQRPELRKSLRRHEAILATLAESIQKSKKSLERLKEVDVTVEEIAKLKEVQVATVDNVDADGTSNIPTTRSYQVSEIIELSDLDLHSSSLAKKYCATISCTDSVPTGTSCNVEKALSDVGLSQGSFLGLIKSEKELMLILQLSAREILSLDGKDKSGRHRREVMFGTCIDIRQMNSINFSDKCNDIKDSTSVALAVGATVINRIDPDVAFCPYELMGTCADPSCVYQHFSNRQFGAVLPKELIPLPDIAIKADRRVALRSKSVSEVEKASKKAAISKTTVEDNDDFVLLPDTVDTATPRWDEAIRLWIRKSSCNKLWWMSDDQVEIVIQTTTLPSFLDFMRAIFGKDGVLGDTLVLHEDHIPKTAAHGCKFLGMIIDSFRIAIHAGRFDFSNAIVIILKQVKSTWKRQKQSATSHRNMYKAMKGTYMLLTTTNSNVRSNNRVSGKNPFVFLFEAQVVTSFASLLFEKLHNGFLVDPDAFFPDCSVIFDTFDYLFEDADVQKDVPLTDFISTFRDELNCKRVDESEVDGINAPSIILDLLRKVHSCSLLSKRCCSNNSYDSLVNDVLIPTSYASSRMIRDAAENDEECLPILLIGSVWLASAVVGCLKDVANKLSTDEDVDSNKLQLGEVYVTINSLFQSHGLYMEGIPSIELLFAPIIAGNVSLGCAIRSYNFVHCRLEELLLPDDANDPHVVKTMNLVSLSEYLWSQFIQLRMSLPAIQSDVTLTDDVNSTWSIPERIILQSELLAKLVAGKHVFPNHVSLINDWNLSRALLEELSVHDKDEGSDIHLLADFSTNLRQLISEDRVQTFNSFALRGHPLSFLSGVGGESVHHPIPYSLLLAAQHLTRLILSACKINRLPHHFGHYFSSLKYIDLSENNLEELPDSICELKHLVTVNFSRNLLCALPVNFAPRNLKYFDASKNRLRKLPESFADCTDVEVLNLEDNLLDSSFWSIAGKLTKLRELRPHR